MKCSHSRYRSPLSVMSPAVLLLHAAAVVSALPDDISQASVQSTCCSQVFLSSSGQLADTNQDSLGIYTISSQKIANNDHPVFVKHSKSGDFYLYYRVKGDG